MYKKLVFDEYFSEENQEDIGIYGRKIALSLISPNQVVHAAPINSLVVNHLELSLSIICDLYNIPKPIRGDYRLYMISLMSEISKHLKDDERNYIIIRYILLRDNRIAYVEYPYFITNYEYERMKEIDKVFKQYDIESHALIHKYDPISNENLMGNAITFEKSDDSDSALKKSLDYIQEHGLVTDYELNAPDEHILKL